MSTQPPPYVRQASLTGFHTESAPTVGQDAEAEFNAIKTSLDATQSRLGEIQRDDGRLSNLSVHPDALSSAVRALISIQGDIRGQWMTAQVYGLGDVIEGPDGVTYLSTAEHVANGSFAVDENAGLWIPIDSGKALDTTLRGDIVSGDVEGPLRADLADDDAGKGADLVVFRDGLAPAFLKTVSDILQGNPVNAFRNLTEAHIADIRAGADSDSVTTAVTELLVDMQAANRGHLILSKGVYCLETGFNLLSSGGISQLRISGEAGGYTILKRNADFAESVYNISGIDNLVIEDVAIDGGHATYSGGNHGIAISNGSNIRVRRVHIRNHKNTGILIFQNPSDTRPLITSNNVVEDCLIDGLGEANNGILLGDAQYSGIRGCHVRDLGKTGSPQYALQIKGISNNCFITNSSAVNARAGIAFGQETAEPEAVIDSLVTNCIVRNCVWGVYVGLAARNKFSSITIDNESQGSHGIEMLDSHENTFKDISLRGQLTGSQYSVKFGGTSSDNKVEFSSLNVSDTIPQIVICEANALNNDVNVEKLKNTATLTYTDQCMSDSAATAGNSLTIGGYVTSSSVTIAGGVILIKNPKAELVRVNTEASAATDDLDTINSKGRDGQRIELKTTANSRDVTIKHGTGNISLVGGADFTLLTINYRIVLRWDAGISKWCEISRAANA